jgi:ferredoxin
MIRTIIEIDQDKCIGCGLCVNACHEHAIGLQDGKAVLLRDDYCDGLGNCLPTCPTGAITFTEREAAAYDRQAVEAHIEEKQRASINRQFPVQARLLSPLVPYLEDADVLLVADCAPVVMGDFRSAFPFTYTTLIACPKLDQTDYEERLGQIFSVHKPKSIKVVVMDVPCCNGLWYAANQYVEAEREAGNEIVLEKVTVGVDGRILSEAP